LTFIREKLADKYNNAAKNPAMYAVSKFSRSLDTVNDILRPRDGGVEENNNPARILHVDKPVGTTPPIIAAINLLPASSLAEKAKVRSTDPYEAEVDRKIFNKVSHSQVVDSTIVPDSIKGNERKSRRDLLSNNETANNDPLLTDTFPLQKAISITESTIRDPTSMIPTNVVLSAKIETPDSQNPIDVYISNPLQAELNSSVLQSSVIHSEQLQNQVFPHIVGGDTQLTDSLQEAIEGLKIDSTKMHKCEKCHDNIRVGDVVVIAEKANNVSWHPGCFVCSVCNELLVDLVYFYYKNNLYCGRDLATFLGIPRCFACDEVNESIIRFSKIIFCILNSGVFVFFSS